MAMKGWCRFLNVTRGVADGLCRSDGEFYLVDWNLGSGLS